MPAKIPWEIIGPAAGVVIILLLIIFKFMIKWKKLEKSPAPPSNLNTVSKKTLCFQHESRIASNETAVKMIGDQLKVSNKDNSDAHGKLFDKLEDLGKDIIKEIHKK